METRCEEADRSQKRPFLERSGVRSRGYSARLQRLVVSFACDHSLSKASSRVLEHHGVEVCESAVDRMLAEHAARAASLSPSAPAGTLHTQGSQTILTGADGTMIPTWTYQDDAADRRKAKRREFREMRLFVAREKGSQSSSYAGGFVDMEQAAACWSHCVKLAGWSPRTYIHGVFDGADWIRRRFEEQFGAHGDWLVDFFHLGEYLAEASKGACLGEDWLSSAMSRTKRSELSETIRDLRENLEDEGVPDEDAPVRSALRYIVNRAEHLDYASAIERDLPIGSGLTEGAHRHVLHPKLKVPGAWLPSKAHDIAQLIFVRENQRWEDFWKTAA